MKRLVGNLVLVVVLAACVVAALVTRPAALLITTRNAAPESGPIAAGIESDSAVAPAMSQPFFCH